MLRKSTSTAMQSHAHALPVRSACPMPLLPPLRPMLHRCPQ